MICIMLYPFFVVTLYTVREVLMNKKNTIKKKGSGDWVNKENMVNTRAVRTITFLLDWGLPLLVTLFVIFFWLLGMINVASPDIESIC